MLDQNLEAKIDEIIVQMTLDEKIGMVHGAGLFRTKGVERLHIPDLKFSDGPMGVRGEFEDAHWVSNEFGDDVVSYCPSNSAIASTWNPKLAASCGQVLGREARGRGKDMILAPGINVQRIPECGRNFEYMSEDPYLIARLVVPVIKGIQESDVAACVKHFALNQQETERLWVNVELSEEALREIYLPGFEAAVKEAETYSIMGAYNLYHGRHCCENKELLDGILRSEWGFDGVVVSDWGAVHDTNEAASASLDIEMSVTPDFDEYCLANPLKEKIKSGEISEELLDAKIRNILRLMFRIHAMDEDRKAGAYNAPEHRADIRRAAQESVVLLKNENILPLDPKAKEKILIVGENAIRRHSLGGGSAEIKALYEITPLLGIKMLLGGNAKVSFAKGYESEQKAESETNWQEESLSDAAMKKEEAARTTANKALFDEAIAAAKEADRIIFVGGLNHDFDTEGADRSSLELPYGQDELINALLDVNENMTVVMMSGSPVDMSAWSKRVKSLLWTSYAGMEWGCALADVLFGKVNPSGHLPVTFPYEETKQFHPDVFGRPLTEEEKTQMNARTTQSYDEGRLVGYRYYTKNNIPVQFPFGYGLSYTEFSMGEANMSIEQPYFALSSLPEKTKLASVSIPVKNIGEYAGKALCQLYVGRKNPDTDEALYELKGFEKLKLEAGEEKTAQISLDARAFAHYDSSKKSFVIKADTYVIYTGNHVKDLRICGEICVDHEIIIF